MLLHQEFIKIAKQYSGKLAIIDRTTILPAPPTTPSTPSTPKKNAEFYGLLLYLFYKKIKTKSPAASK